MLEESITGNFNRIPEEAYVSAINTPSRDPRYFEAFHKPLVQRAINRNGGKPISLVDVACGYAHELDFLRDNLDVELWGADIADKVLEEARKRIPNAHFLQHDARSPDLPFEPGSMDIAIAVNAMTYTPDKILEFIYRSLKGDGEAAVNFRDASNPKNKAFYDYNTARGAKVYDITVALNRRNFEMTMIDYREMDDEVLKNLDRQVFFKSIQDMEDLIGLIGFIIVEHNTFSFPSPANPENMMDVYTLKKHIPT